MGATPLGARRIAFAASKSKQRSQTSALGHAVRRYQFAVSVDHGAEGKGVDSAKPVSLDVKPGMTVIVGNNDRPGETLDKNWWMEEVIHCCGAAHAPSIHNPVQVADVNTGVIRWINANLATHIPSYF